MPTRHGGSCMNQDSTFERRSARRTTTVPCSSTACTWKPPFARSTPTVLIFFMDGSRVLVSAIQLWHIDAGRGPSTPSWRAEGEAIHGAAALDRFAAARLAMTAMGRLRLAARGVEAPGAAAGGREIEEDEAIEDGRVAAVGDREEAVRRGRHEIGDRHVAAEDEADRAGEETDDDHDPAHQLDQPLEGPPRQ